MEQQRDAETQAAKDARIAALEAELAEARRQQVAAAEALKAVGQAGSDLQAVLDMLAETTSALCEGEDVSIHRIDGERVLIATHFGTIPIPINRSYAPTVSAPPARSMRECRRIQVVDLQAETTEYPIGSASAQRTGARTFLCVPLIRGETAIGAFVLRRTEARPFTDRQIALVETFATQAAIAIENARLLDELQTRQMDLEARSAELAQSLEYQEAISAVLNEIARSRDTIGPVIDTILETAVRLAEAQTGTMRRKSDERYEIIAFFGRSKEERVFEEQYWGSEPPLSVREAVETRRSIQNTNIQVNRPDYVDRLGSRASLSVPLLSKQDLVGVLTLGRKERQAFTPKQIALVETFADQAVIAIENARLLDELQTRQRELTESLEYQTAIADVLTVIAGSPGQIQEALDTIAKTARGLCDADRAIIWRDAGDILAPAAFDGVSPERVAPLRAHRMPKDRGSTAGMAIADRRVVHTADVLADPLFAATREFNRQAGTRTMLSVPLLTRGAPLGSLTLVRSVVSPFSDKQIEFVRAFADQAVIAIENARLLDELQTRQRELEARSSELAQSLEYQTAISDVLGAISRSKFDLQPILDTIIETAARLAEADKVALRRKEGDIYRMVARRGYTAEQEQWLDENFTVPPAGSVTARVIAERRAVHVADAKADPIVTKIGLTQAIAASTVLVVPLLRDGEVVGVLALYRSRQRPFTLQQIELIETFADQAVIAIENARLLDELRSRQRELEARSAELAQSLEYQTASSEVLSIISKSPSDIHPVLEAIVETSINLCKADRAAIFLLKDGTYQYVTSRAYLAHVIAEVRRHPLKPNNPGSVIGRVSLTKRAVHIPDIADDPEFTHRDPKAQGRSRTNLGVPLVRSGEVIGVILLSRIEVAPFTQRQILLVTAFADQAVIAINNVGLLAELQARSKELAQSVDELRSLGEVGRTVSSTLDMPKVLQTILEHASKMTFAGGGTIYVYDGATREFHVEAGYNMNEEHTARVRAQPMRLGDPVVGECAERREAVQIEDLNKIERDRSPLIDILSRAGVRAILAVPLLHQDEVIGALVVRRTTPGAFTPETVRLLEAFAAQSAIAVNNARLFKEVEEKGEQLRLASQHKSQFLANMSHELRTPLNAILGYTELMQDGIYGVLPERAGGVLGRVQTNGKHLLGLINSVLDLSKIEAGQLTLDSVEYGLPGMIEAAIVATESLATEKKLAIRSEIVGNLPRGTGDERRLSQVLLNLVGNAIKFTDQGGITIGARQVSDRFHVFVRDTGPGIPPAEKERIFEEFHQMDSSNTKAKGGTGLGLAIAKRIIDMHGGRIWVESVRGEGATFRFEVPVTASSGGEQDG